MARLIRESGFHVYPQVGVKGFRIDLGVVDPSRPGEFILGVECDGAAYHSARSTRDRDRLRQQVLEGLGWRLHRIWSTNWFRNPRGEADKLIAAIKQAKGSTIGPKVASDDEIVDSDEVEEVEETSAPTVLGAVIKQNLTLNVVRYKECVLKVPFTRNLLDIPVPELSRFALEIVESEGPVHTDEVARRIREAFRLQKTAKRIFTHVKSSLEHLHRRDVVTREGDFWSSIGQSISVPRCRRNAANPLRRATMIVPSEYELALVAIICEAVSISHEALAVETARMFGFDRRGPDLREAIDREVERLVKSERIQLDESGLHLPNSNGPKR